MPCCGGTRTSTPASHTHSPLAPVTPPVTFVYTGKTALTVIGGVTRRQYRFEGPGASLAVDAHDAPGLHAIPTLAPSAG